MSGAAPGDLEVLRAFVNTCDPDAGGDAVGSPEALGCWLAGHALLGAGEGVGPGEHRRALRLREALRRLGKAHHDGRRDPAAAEEVDALAASTPLAVRLGEDGRVRLEALGQGVEAALGRLLAILYTATVEGTWGRFKVCSNDTCGWAFYDHSKNRSGRFCGPGCANAVHARAYRRRKAAASPPGGPGPGS